MKKVYAAFATVMMLSFGFAQNQNSIKQKPINIQPSGQINTTSVGLPTNNSVSNTISVPGLTNNGTSSVANQNDPHGHYCKSHQLTQEHYEEMGVWDQSYQQYMIDAASMSNYTHTKAAGPNTIPVIFHVVHEGESVGTGTNISYAAIMNVFNDLVEDFQLLNADASNARGAYGFTPADANIDFCLAQQDPNGVPLTEIGVTRIQTTQTWFDSDDPSEVNAMKSAPLGSPIWDRDDYLNVWICDISNGAGSGTAGYAYRPQGGFLPNASIDGIVIDYNLGVNNDNVLTHEVGHYLGLMHTWGNSGGCGDDDGFTDTPVTFGPSFNQPGASCSGFQEYCSGVQTQYENYMDYSNCTVMFTQQQADYMDNLLNTLRSSLFLSSGCDPAGPPICSFTSSPSGPVTISTNGTVIFQDASTGAPTSWAWTISGTQGTDWAYTGGTNANSQNPEVTFYNTGTYDVTLVATNGFGSCTGVTQNTYVTVIAPASGTSCDTLRNWNPLTEGLAWYGNGADWGYLIGHGQISGFGYDEYAEKYTPTSAAEVRRLRIPVMLVEDVSGTGSVTFLISDDDNGGTDPGTILGGVIVDLANLNDFAWNEIDLPTPVAVTGSFWVSVQMNYGSPQDTISIAVADFNDRPAGAGTTRMYINGAWYGTDDIYNVPTGINMSAAWDVLLSNGPDPIADLQVDATELCVGGQITGNGSGSTNTTDYYWYQTDDNPLTTIYDIQYTAGAAFDFGGLTAGDYQLWLFADGSCKSDYDTVEITLYDVPSATINITHTTCGLNNGQINITAPTGGNGSYEYSLDGTNWTTTTTYSNLPAGSYDVYVRTSGDACEAMSTVNINGSVPLSGTLTPSTVALCDGLSTTLTASGGTTYDWYDGATLVQSGATNTLTVTPSASAQYTVEISDGTCSDLQYSNVTVYALPTVDAGAPQTVCNGASVTLSGSGATSYSWDNGVSNNVPFTATATTTYTVTGTDGNGCQNTDQVTVTINALPTVDAGAPQTVCNGASVTLSGSGATSYSWDNGVTDGVPFTATSTTTYTVTGTDGNGCQNTDQVVVSVNALPSVDAGTNQTVCNGASVTLSGSGATSYTWDNGVTNGVAFTATATTIYTVTGTDGNGCQNTDQVTVNVNPLPTVDAGLPQTVCQGSSVTLTGSGASSYSWDNGVSDGVAFTATTTTTYTVTGTNGNGCQNTDQVTVTVNPTPTTSGLTEVCNGTNTAYTVSFNVSSGSSPYTVTGESGSFAGSTWTSVLINSGTPYNLTITDNNGCAASAVNGVMNCSCTSDAGTMVTSPTITVCGNGSATATHNSDETFDGDDVMEFYLHDASGAALGTTIATSSTPTFSFTGGMTYGTTYYISAVVGNNAGGGVVDLADPCLSVSAGTPVVWYNLPTVDAGTNQTVCSGSSVTLSGSGASSYSWDNGISNGVAFTATSTTIYTVTGTDGNGCQNTDQVTVNVNALPSVNAGTDQTVCNGASVTLSGSGATSFTWNNGVTDGVPFTATSTTTYTVTGTDGNGCQNTDQVIVNVNALPTVDAGTNQTVCNGASVTLSGSGATSYSWDNGVTNGVAFTATATTIYTVTGTDGNGCQNTDQVTVNVNALPTVVAGTDQTVCENASVTLSGSGAVNYSWDNGVNDGVPFTATSTNTYTVTGTDGNGCQNTDQVTVTVNAAPTVSAGPDQTVCEGDAVTLSGSGATSYTWNNGVTDGVSFTATSTTTYTVTGVDGAGCSNTDQVSVIVNPGPTVNAGTDQTVCEGEMVTLSGSGTTSYSWDNGVTDGTPFAATTTTTYTVTGTDGIGCSATDQVTITVNPAPAVTGNITHDSGAGDGAIDISVSSGTAPYTFSWDNGETTEDISNLSAGDYVVTVTDANGCESIVTFTVLSTVGLDEEASFDIQLYPNPTMGQFTVFVIGDYEIAITDARGRLVLRQTTADQSEYDLSSYESGMYFIRISKGSDTVIKKLILN